MYAHNYTKCESLFRAKNVWGDPSRSKDDVYKMSLSVRKNLLDKWSIPNDLNKLRMKDNKKNSYVNHYFLFFFLNKRLLLKRRTLIQIIVCYAGR